MSHLDPGVVVVETGDDAAARSAWLEEHPWPSPPWTTANDDANIGNRAIGVSGSRFGDSRKKNR
jgi:hypothetical protein